MNLTVVLLTVPAAIGAPPMTAAEVRAEGMTFDPHLLRNPELWWALGHLSRLAVDGSQVTVAVRFCSACCRPRTASPQSG